MNSLPQYSVFKVTGPDATRYLNGRATQDLKDVPEGEVRSSYLLSPQGKVQGKFYFGQLGGTYYLILEGFDAEQFIEDLFRFKVADQVDIEAVIEKAELVIGDSLGVSDGQVKKLSPKGFALNPNVLSTPSVITVGADSKSPKEIDANEASKHFIESCEPRVECEINSGTIVTDLPLEKFVSFNKGCYAGQEVVERATAKGRPNKKLIKLSSTSPLTKGQKVLLDQQKVGAITSVAQAEESLWIALALVKFKVDSNSKFDFD